jgi:hypothetical protein
MQIFNDKRTSIAALGLVAGLASVSLTSCGGDGLPGGDVAEKVCGPCGSIATGQLSISGNAQLDGFFNAVADLQGASGTLRGNFEGELQALANLYGRGDAEINAELVTALIGDIRADITGSVSGSFRLQYQPPRCSASVDVAIEAQASCEANADCEASATPPSASVECSGQCTGSCSGGCSGSVSCTPPGGAVDCDAGCDGACAFTTAAQCDGTCNGACDGECTLMDADGQCQGECSGMCDGTCEFRAMAMCEGTCHGECHASVTPPECEAQPVTCNAECMGMCEGGCNGDFVAPSASVDCEASAECEAQASASAEANVECTPPSLDFGFELDASLSADARAQFLARLGAVRVHLAGALQAAAQARALVDGEINGEVVFTPSPVARLTASLEGFVSGGVDGFADLDIPTGRLPCLIPAFQESISALGDTGDDLRFTATASVDLFAFVANPTG